jgi:predicted nucleic acid-binding protein
MRIVVDTNVFISGMTSPAGENRQVIRACLEQKVRPLMGAALFHEYEDLIARPETLQRFPCQLPMRMYYWMRFSPAAIGFGSIFSGGPIFKMKRIII